MGEIGVPVMLLMVLLEAEESLLTHCCAILPLLPGIGNPTGILQTYWDCSLFLLSVSSSWRTETCAK